MAPYLLYQAFFLWWLSGWALEWFQIAGKAQEYVPTTGGSLSVVRTVLYSTWYRYLVPYPVPGTYLVQKFAEAFANAQVQRRCTVQLKLYSTGTVLYVFISKCYFSRSIEVCVMRCNFVLRGFRPYVLSITKETPRDGMMLLFSIIFDRTTSR